MAKSQHTPGPWYIDPPSMGFEAICQEKTGNVIFALAFPHKRYGDKITEETAKHNARLIAQSPALLEMLEVFVNAYDFKGNEISDSDLCPEQPKFITVTFGDLEKSARIIAKAKGGQNV